VKVLGFQRRALDPDVYSLAWGRDTLLPIQPWKPIFDAALRRPVTWRRRIAQNRDDVSLLRPGAPLIDALDRLLDWDDRGSAFATWRLRLGWGDQGEERLAFRLCWRISPDPIAGTGLRRDEERTGLDRRAASFLKPWTVVQYLGADLVSVDDPELLQILNEPYRPQAEDGGGRDYNLGSREAWLRQIIDPDAFARLCGEVRERGRSRLQDGEPFRSAVADATRQAAADTERRKLRAQARRRGAGMADGTQNRELALDGIVLDAVRKPLLRLDSVGVFVLAGYVPPERRP
jgi:ATP-dependent helicase HepA